MPNYPDKIIINSSDFVADAERMRAAFDSAAVLSQEIIDCGKTVFGKDGIVGNEWLKEDADQHLAEQEKICADLDKAMADCTTRQRALTDKRRKWFDKILDGKLTP